MLESIEIYNFILIDHQYIDFNQQINVITGDTGSGKSVLINAIRFAFGMRGSTDLLFDETKDIKVIAKLKLTPQLAKRLDEVNIDYDDSIEVMRVYSPSGKNKIRVNGELVTQKDLVALFEELITIYSQYSVAKFKSESNYLQIIDNLAENSKLLQEYQQQYEIYRQMQLKLKELNGEQGLKDERLSLLKMRLEDFEEIDTDLDVIELLDEKQKVDENIKNTETTQQSTIILDSVITELNKLQDIVNNDNQQILLKDALINIEEVSYDISKNNMVFDEFRANFLTDYVSNVKRLARKYNLEYKDLNQFKQSIIQEVANLDSIEIDIANLESKSNKQYQLCYDLGVQLSKSRSDVITDFTYKVNTNMKKLSLAESDFMVKIEEVSIHKHGIDNCQFHVRMNEGSDYSLIHKTASGGEIARFLLALEALTGVTSPGLIIFDEIDTGVSGAVASEMATMMKEISKTSKLIIVTHLAQVAAISNNHYFVDKAQVNGVTTSNIKLLTTEEKPFALAKMISGKEVNDDAVSHAKQLLNSGQE